MSLVRSLALFSGAAMLASTLAAPPVSADEISDFYKRKRITIYVGYTPGARCSGSAA